MKIIGSQFRLSVGKLISKLLASFPFWGALLIATGMGLSSPSAETITYTDLNDNTEIHAIDLTTLFKNAEDYTIYASGGNSTSETPSSLNFSLSGIYGDGNERPIENSGNLEIFAAGGEGTGDIYNASVLVYGIDTNTFEMDLENNGHIMITATGGTSYSNASVYAYGIQNYSTHEVNIAEKEDTKIINRGNIRITAEGGGGHNKVLWPSPMPQDTGSSFLYTAMWNPVEPLR